MLFRSFIFFKQGKRFDVYIDIAEANNKGLGLTDQKEKKRLRLCNFSELFGASQRPIFDSDSQ